MARRIFFSQECDRLAQSLGGYQQIDNSLDAAWDGFINDPRAFPKVLIDGFAVRYLATKPCGDCPALIWKFVIESSGDVEIVGVEEFEGF
jgi:hypothetical protein